MSSTTNRVELQLTPLNDLILIQEIDNLAHYHMIGSDPFFYLGACDFTPGYYEIAFEFGSPPTQLVQPTLYIDSGHGFNEAENIRLRFFSDELESRARIFLAKGAKALRFDPSCQQGLIIIGRISLRKVSSLSIVIQEARREVRSLMEKLDVRDALREVSSNWNVDRYLSNWTENGCNFSFDKNIVYDGKKYSLKKTADEYVYTPPRKTRYIDECLSNIRYKHIFSIVVPAYNTPLELMKKLYESVHMQWYPHWELIVIDDASRSVEAVEFLDGISDIRVKIHRSKENRGIAGATNIGIEKATGEYIVLLDHDDELTPDCLYELAVCANATGADYIYSDEDKIDLQGKFSEPHFKPDWSPDALMSTMYVCHVSCIRRSLLNSVGGLRSQYDGCQDWDLVLRITEATQKIAHIPKVLYHWRTLPGSVSVGLSEKPYVLEATKRVRSDAIKRRGLNGSVESIPGHPGYFGVKYEPRPGTVVSIVIPTRDNGEILRRCIESLNSVNSYHDIEVIVVDNGSCDPQTADYLTALSKSANTRVVRWDAKFNFSELCNIGAQNASGEVILFLNDDTEILEPDSLARMIGFAQLSHVGAVGAKLLYPGGHLIQHCGILNLNDGPGHAYLRQSAGVWGYFGRNVLDYNWLAVTGACLMVERTKFEKIGGFDETFPIAYNDVELCFRLRNTGLYNVMCQRAVLLHHESISRGSDNVDPIKLKRLRDERIRLYCRHPQFFQRDPFYNINLHPNGINFDCAI